MAPAQKDNMYKTINGKIEQIYAKTGAKNDELYEICRTRLNKIFNTFKYRAEHASKVRYENKILSVMREVFKVNIGKTNNSKFGDIFNRTFDAIIDKYFNGKMEELIGILNISVEDLRTFFGKCVDENNNPLINIDSLHDIFQNIGNAPEVEDGGAKPAKDGGAKPADDEEAKPADDGEAKPADDGETKHKIYSKSRLQLQKLKDKYELNKKELLLIKNKLIKIEKDLNTNYNKQKERKFENYYSLYKLEMEKKDQLQILIMQYEDKIAAIELATTDEGDDIANIDDDELAIEINDLGKLTEFSRFDIPDDIIIFPTVSDKQIKTGRPDHIQYRNTVKIYKAPDFYRHTLKIFRNDWQESETESD